MTLPKGNILYYLTGLAVTGSFIWCVYILAYHEIPEANRDLFIHMLGMIDGAFVGGMVASFFGSSKREHEVGTSTETETKSETNQP